MSKNKPTKKKQQKSFLRTEIFSKLTEKMYFFVIVRRQMTPTPTPTPTPTTTTTAKTTTTSITTPRTTTRPNTPMPTFSGKLIQAMKKTLKKFSSWFISLSGKSTGIKRWQWGPCWMPEEKKRPQPDMSNFQLGEFDQKLIRQIKHLLLKMCLTIFCHQKS